MIGQEALGGVQAVVWDMVETDGVHGLDPAWLRVGAMLRWHGRPVRLDGQAGVLPLPRGRHDTQPRARRVAERLSGRAHPDPAPNDTATPPPGGMVLTDGARRFTARLVQGPEGWLAVFADGLPPRDRPLWVVATDLHAAPGTPAQAVICFAAETEIATPSGPRAVDAIAPGDRVLTRDNGPCPVLWAGQSTLSGLALRHHPHLRPVRLRRGALGGVPHEDLRVSPAHRVLVQGARAQALYGCDEVLVRATDLVDHRLVAPDLALHGVSYVHLLLESHQILFANGVPAESFHPGMAPPETMRQHRAAIRDVLPEIAQRPARYGPPARRCLAPGEAALLAA